MSDELKKRLQQKWNNDVEEMNFDSESDQQQIDYVESLIRAQKEHAQNMKQSSVQNVILQTMQEHARNEEAMIEEFKEKASKVAKMTKDQKAPLEPQKIRIIKEKAAAEAASAVFTFTEEKLEIQQAEKQKSYQENHLQNLNRQGVMGRKGNDTGLVDPLTVKLEKAALERELLSMEREDGFSMKFEIECLSQLFSDRFIQPKIPVYKQNYYPLLISITQPKNTFTNLRPMPNTTFNVLPKNSPQIALRTIKRAKKLSLIPESKRTASINLKKVYSSTDNPESESVRDQKLAIDVLPKEDAARKNMDNILNNYIISIKDVLKSMEQICKQYHPKFIKRFLDSKQKALNVDISQPGSSQQKSLESMQDGMNLSKLKELSFTFESLTSLKGIQIYESIQSAGLQYNLLREISGLSDCQRLIEVNLSHNKLRSLSLPLEALPWLKFMNAEHNQITQVSLPCESLEIALLNNNKIVKLTPFGQNIRVLDLSCNSLAKISGLDRSYFLEQLNLQKNVVQSMKGLENCILLRKLNLANNRLLKDLGVERCVFLFLSQLNLNSNSIEELPLCFLPSLEHLLLESNRLKEHSKTMLYFPNMKVLNLDNNLLEGFGAVWSMLRFSLNLEYLNYDNNEYFLDLRDEPRALYESIIFRNMKSVTILNDNPTEAGLKKFYESAFKIYLKNFSMFASRSPLLDQLQKKIDFLLKQSQQISRLVSEKTKFSQTNQFIRYKSADMAGSLMQIVQFVESGNSQMLRVVDSVFYRSDLYEVRLRKALQKIRSLLVRWRYRRQRRAKYYKRHAELIWQNWQNIGLIVDRLKLRSGFEQLHLLTQKFTHEEAAVYIQKIWRGFVLRRRYLKIMSKLKEDDDSFDDLQDPQDILNEFSKYESSHQPCFDIPDNLNFEDFIIKPEVFTLLEQQQKKSDKKIEEQEKKQLKNHPMVNNYLDDKNQSSHSESVHARRTREDEEDERLMKEWGFKDRATLEGFKLKRRKKEEMKRKEHQKNMTPQERIQRFRKGGH